MITAEAWLEQNYGMLVTIARGVLDNEDDARDAAQDAALRLTLKWDMFADGPDGVDRRSSWAYTVAKRVALDALRKQKRRQQREVRLPTTRGQVILRPKEVTKRLDVRRTLALAAA